MFVLKAHQIKKYFGDRLIVDLDDLNIYEDDKIGIVGLNGAGKTTLLNLLSGEMQPDEGHITRIGSISYIKQFGGEDIQPYLSGGEKTGVKIADALESPAHILLADEPTSNLDIYAIEELQKKLCAYRGCVLLISHDRGLLNKVCSKILEIENGKVTLYEGNYEKYRRNKDMEIERMMLDYEEAASERKRLMKTKQAARERLDGMRKTPKRMGNSEARLHKNPSKGKTNQERFIKNIDRRIEDASKALDELPRRQEMKRVKIDIREGTALLSKTALTIENFDLRAGGRLLLDNITFTVKTGSKTALIGANGSGKTTLIKEIINGAAGIRLANSAKTAYFAQDLSLLNENKSILENVEEQSVQTGGEIRTILARLGFKRDEVNKKAGLLSGGEKVKACLAKIFAADVNFLILDEPTNYLDIYAAESLQAMMREYGGTILLVTHDREMIENVADNILIIKNGGVTAFDGGLREYNAASEARPRSDHLLSLENRLAYIAGRLSMKLKTDDQDELAAEYKELAAEIRELKNSRVTGS